jgi:hypothetical protein
MSAAHAVRNGRVSIVSPVVVPSRRKRWFLSSARGEPAAILPIQMSPASRSKPMPHGAARPISWNHAPAASDEAGAAAGGFRRDGAGVSVVGVFFVHEQIGLCEDARLAARCRRRTVQLLEGEARGFAPSFLMVSVTWPVRSGYSDIWSEGGKCQAPRPPTRSSARGSPRITTAVWVL